VGAIRICLLGQFRLELGGDPIRELDPHKAEELLCYLLLHRSQPHHREALASLFCDECSAAESKKRLRHILWRLQSLLSGDAKKADEALLSVDHDWIQLNPNCPLWLDVEMLERAAALVRDVAGEALSREQADVLSKVVTLYRGDLLAGWYEDWCLQERERLQNIYLELLDKLMGFCEARHQYDSGLAYGEQILRHDRASERTYQRLMRLHHRAGARGLAVKQYERCVAALREELDVGPSKRTATVYEQIRIDALPPAAVEPAPPAAAARRGESFQDLIDRLQGFEDALGRIQVEVLGEIRLLRQALKADI
jgi:DNA-binding SARP family transcriptional activator